MKKRIFSLVAALAAVVLLLGAGPAAAAWFDTPVQKDERCAVCGMFVVKYPAWLARIKRADGTVRSFDGVKDMMVYYFDPTRFGDPAGPDKAEIRVKDYYNLRWIDGRKAFYVVGSDVYGPMGHEFIPFALREAAEAFSKDHHGKKILTFDAITPQQVEKMRAGHRMR